MSIPVVSLLLGLASSTLALSSLGLAIDLGTETFSGSAPDGELTRSGGAPEEIPRKDREAPKSGALAEQEPRIDQRTGSFQYSVPIEVPAGVRDLQPLVHLRYSSASRSNGPLGIGWSLTAGGAVGRHGPPLQDPLGDPGELLYLSGAPTFTGDDTYRLNGRALVPCEGQEGGASVDCPPGTYRSQENDFRLVEETAAGWQLTDPDGTVHTFETWAGKGSGLPGTSKDDYARFLITQTRWAMNVIDYEYVDISSSERRIEYIRWGGQTNGTVSSGHLWRMRFVWDTSRPDEHQDWRQGRLDVTARLSDIYVETANGDQIRHYELEYETSPSSYASRLVSVQEHGTEDTQLVDPHVFTYVDNASEGWASDGAFDGVPSGTFTESLPSGGRRGRNVNPVDLNGDGLIDLVRHVNNQSLGYTETDVWIATGTGWDHHSTSDEASAWRTKIISAGLPYTHREYTPAGDVSWMYEGVLFVDLNADGYPDVIQSNQKVGFFTEGDWETGAWLFDPDLDTWSAVDAEVWVGPASDPIVRLSWDDYGGESFGSEDFTSWNRLSAGTSILDVNGDDRPDAVVLRSGKDPSLAVYLNEGGGFDFTGTSWDIQGGSAQVYNHGQTEMPHPPGNGPSSTHLGVRLADVNGDGLPDLVRCYREETWKYCEEVREWGPTQLEIWLNTGQGWTAVDLDLIVSLQAAQATAAGYSIPGGTRPAQYESLAFDWGYIQDPTSTCSGYEEIYYASHDDGTRLLDVNGDGRADLIRSAGDPSFPNNPIRFAMTNRWNGWSLDGDWEVGSGSVEALYPFVLFDYSEKWRATGIHLMDYNNDGLLDVIRDDHPTTRLYRNLARWDRDLLSTVTRPQGSTDTIEYHRLLPGETHPDMGGPRVVVGVIERSTGITTPTEGPTTPLRTEYEYYGGTQDRLRGDRGFRAVVTRDVPDPGDTGTPPLCRTTWFAVGPDDYCRYGKVEFVVTSELVNDGTVQLLDESFDPVLDDPTVRALSVYSATRSEWPSGFECPASYAGPYFSPPRKTVSTSYDPGFDPAQPVPTMVATVIRHYGDFGNVEFEEVVLDGQTTPYRSVETSYVSVSESDPLWVVGLPCTVLLRDRDGDVRRRTVYYYGSQYGGSGECTELPSVSGIPADADGLGLVARTEETGYQPGSVMDSETWTTYEYTTRGNIHKVIDALGEETISEWNHTSHDLPEARPYKETNAEGHWTKYSYDWSGNRTATRFIQSVVDTVEYDVLHRVSAEWRKATVDGVPMPRVDYTYVSMGSQEDRRTTRAEKLDATRSILITEWMDGLGRTYRSATEASDASEKLGSAAFFDSRGRVRLETRPKRYTSTEPPYDATLHGTEWERDPLGRITNATVPGGYSTAITRTYDNDNGEGMLVEVTSTSNYNPELDETKSLRTYHYYDCAGRLRRVSECSSDDCDDPDVDDVYTTRYGYDHEDRLLAICYADVDGDCGAASRTRYFYDGLGRKVGFKDPDLCDCPDGDIDDLLSGCPWRFEYDEVGNLVLATDANYAIDPTLGSETEYTHDGIGRVETKTVTEGRGLQPPKVYEYTSEYDGFCGGTPSFPVGRLSEETVELDGEYRVYRCYRYDGAGRLRSRSTVAELLAEPIGGGPGGGPGGSRQSGGSHRELPVEWGDYEFDIEYEYNARGDVVEETLSDDVAVVDVRALGYDGFGRPISLQSSVNGTIVSDVEYDGAWGRESTRYYDGDAYMETLYRTGAADQPSGDLRLQERIVKGITVGTNPYAVGHEYDYDTLGNPVSVAGLGYSFNFGLSQKLEYDHVQRLIEVQRRVIGGGGAYAIEEAWKYDSLGNRAQTWDVATSSWKISEFGDAYSAIEEGGIHALRSVGGSTLEYDHNGNCVDDGSNTVEYNHLNKVRKVIVGVIPHRYYYGPQDDRIIAVEDGTIDFYMDPRYEVRNGSVVIYYSWGDELVARRGTSLEFYYANHLGSVAATWDETGTVQRVVEYRAFGDVHDELVGGNPLEYRFGGKELDPFGYYYYEARSYLPAHGVFLQADRVRGSLERPQSLNRYAFVENSPYRYVDPTGEFALAVNLPGIGAALAATAVMVGAAVEAGGESVAEGVDSMSQWIEANFDGAAAEGVFLVGSGSLAERGALGLIVGYAVAQKADKRAPAPRGGTRPGDLPADGTPNSTDVVDRGGGKGTIRDYGPDGRAKTDYDFGHDHRTPVHPDGAGDPHAHDWDWSKRSKERQPPRPLKSGE
jgi:RHS repeat-associated protein